MVQQEDPDFESLDSPVSALEDDDVALRPGPNADDSSDFDAHLPPDFRAKYDVYSYRHAFTILRQSFPQQLQEILDALNNFSLTTRDIGLPGGNESIIPKKFSKLLRPCGWVETRIQGDLLVRLEEYDEELTADGRLRKVKRLSTTAREVKNFIDGHKIDYVKGRVAFDLEWNSKDQTFDRDLYALRAFHECGLISVGVLVTRSASLNPLFDSIQQLDKHGQPVGKSVKAKYGASTTWMGKLLYRLNAGRHGGCPVLVFGIKPALILEEQEPKHD